MQSSLLTAVDSPLFSMRTSGNPVHASAGKKQPATCDSSQCLTEAHSFSREPSAGHRKLLQWQQPQDWKTGLPTFERLRYAGVYAGVDLIYYGNQGSMEFDFEIAPGANRTHSIAVLAAPKT